MKRILILLLLAPALFAEEPWGELAEEPWGELAESLPPAAQILAGARAQLPAQPVRLIGTLKTRAPNGFVKNKRNVLMLLDWSAQPPVAKYELSDPSDGIFQTLEIKWNQNEAEYSFFQNEEKKEFNPYSEIGKTGVTWSDLSFGFLWNPAAKTIETDKKLGRNCYVLSIPRPQNQQLLLWIEQETGRMLGAEERNEAGKTVKIIKVVSVKEFDGLWMVKDLDIIRPADGGRTSLRIDSVEPIDVRP